MWSILFDYSSNSVNFLQAKELSEINQDIQSASSTTQPQFLPILSRRRGGTCTRLGPSIWDLRVAGCRFHVACSSHGCYDCERHQTPADCGISRNARERACVLFRTVEFIDAPKSSVELWNICAGLTIVHTSCQNDRSFSFFSILFT